MKNFFIIFLLPLALLGAHLFCASEKGKYFLGITAHDVAKKDTTPSALFLSDKPLGNGNGNNGGGNGGGNSGPDTAYKLRQDTITWKFSSGLAAYVVTDSLNLRVNNVKLTNYAGGAGKMDTFYNQKWGNAWQPSGVTLIMWHAAGLLAPNYTQCAGPLAIANYYNAIADGSQKDSIGDPVLGGRDFTFKGLVPNGYYDVEVSGRKDDTTAAPVAVTQILSWNNNAKTSSYNVTNNCSGSVKLTQVQADGTGTLIVNLRGSSITSKTYVGKLRLMTSRMTNRILTSAASSSTNTTPPPSTADTLPYPKNYVPAPYFIPTANDYVAPLSKPFTYGTNLGFYGNGWTDDLVGTLVAKAKGRSLRTAMYDWIMVRNNDSVRYDAFKSYVDAGLDDITLTLGEPDSSHADTTHYAGGGRDHSKLFKNMYKDIWIKTFNSDGTVSYKVNPENYAAAFVEKVVKIYGPFVKYYEVVNEADFTQYPNNWLNRAPLPSELTNILAPIYHYIRFLRIVYEVVKMYQPNAHVAVGGMGYYQFLQVLCRYSDNPVDGSMNDDFPRTGMAYIDVISFHSYPQYYMHGWSNAVGKVIQFANSDTAAATYQKVIQDYLWVCRKFGYDGSKYPAKPFIITETNLGAHSEFGKAADSVSYTKLNHGDSIYQRNGIVKLMIAMEEQKIRAAYIFTTGCHGYWPGDSTWTVFNPAKVPYAKFPYDYWYVPDGGGYRFYGWYNNLDVQPPGKDSLTWEGMAIKTYGILLGTAGYNFDSLKTAQLGLTYTTTTVSTVLNSTTKETKTVIYKSVNSAFNGAVFTNATTGKSMFVLWARTHGNEDESATTTYTIPSSFGAHTLNRYEWDYSVTGLKSATGISTSNIFLTACPSYFEVVN